MLPLSEVLLRMEQVEFSPREAKHLIICLGLHLVNLSNKIKGLEGKLAQPKETETQRLYGRDPVDQQPTDLGSGGAHSIPG